MQPAFFSLCKESGMPRTEPSPNYQLLRYNYIRMTGKKRSWVVDVWSCFFLEPWTISFSSLLKEHSVKHRQGLQKEVLSLELGYRQRLCVNVLMGDRDLCQSCHRSSWNVDCRNILFLFLHPQSCAAVGGMGTIQPALGLQSLLLRAAPDFPLEIVSHYALLGIKRKKKSQF